MAQRICEKDWSATPLGPIDSWSETFATAVNFLLNYPFSFALYWGPARVLLYNDVYVAFLGEKHPAALGAPGHEVWQEAWGAIGPMIDAAMEQGAVTAGSETLIPINVNGVLTDRWWTYGFYPIHERDCIAGVANPGREDTEAVLAKAGLRDSQAQLQQVLAASRDAVVLVDRDWRITYFNSKAESLYGKGLAGTNLWDAFPAAASDGSPFVEHYNRAMYEGVSGSFEATIPALDLMLEAEVYPTKHGIVTFSRDVTERKRIAAALIQSEKLAAVGRLASSVAHEINNPLEAVSNLLYLSEHSDDIGEMKTFIRTAEIELRRIGAITSQTLRFHKQVTRPKVVMCTDLFGEALSIYQGRLSNSQIVLEKRKRAEHPIECFEGEIRQVLSNFISNAIDAMPHGGRLILRSRDATNWRTGKRGVSLTVADTGSGMPESVRSRIFEAFYTTKGIGGTGLGLWISKEIVERHHGGLCIRSSSKPGHSGTVCTVFLPLEAVQRSTPLAETAAIS